jgi:hypothetical protein
MAGSNDVLQGSWTCQALELCDAVYRSCRSGEKVAL